MSNKSKYTAEEFAAVMQNNEKVNSSAYGVTEFQQAMAPTKQTAVLKRAASASPVATSPVATTETPTPTVSPEGGGSGTVAGAGTGTVIGSGTETGGSTSGYTEDEYKTLMTDAKSWGLSQGLNYEAQRDEQIAAVNSAHERNLATYGQRAEQLAQAGLTGSGYSDNLERDAYAAKQQALAEIEKTYRGNEEGLIAAYKAHLEGQGSAVSENQTQANAAFSTILSENEGITTDAAKQQLLALGYTDEEANNALFSHQNLVGTQLESSVNAAFTSGDLSELPTKAELDNAVVLGNISKETAYAQLGTMQTELGNRCTLAVSNESEAEKFLASLGVTPAEGQSVGDAVFAAIDTLYADGKISETKYNEICLAEIQDDLKDNGGNVEAIAEIAAKINHGEGNIGTDANKAAAFAEVCKALGISKEGLKLGGTIASPHLILDQTGKILVYGEVINTPPSTEEDMYRNGDYLYKKSENGNWCRFDLTKTYVGKNTDEQRAGVGAAVLSLFENKDTVQVLKSEKAGQIAGAGGTFENRDGDNGRIRVNGTAYNFEMAEEVAEADTEKLNAALKAQHGRDPQPGDALCYNGKIVVVCDGGGLRYIKNRVNKNYKTIPGVND